MAIEVDVLGETWLTLKEYIQPKDRQAAADHLVSVIADHSITENELKAVGGTDSYLKHAVIEYLGEDEIEDYGDEEDEDY